MTTKQDEFIDTLEGNISPEQLDQLLALDQPHELNEGDTGDKPEQTAQPGAVTTAEAGKPESANSNVGEQELSAENAVILTKDGKHTIGYDKLVEARQGMQHWKAEAAAKDARIAELERQSEARAQAGEAPTAQDNQLKTAQAAIEAGVDPDLFGDFSEEALARGIQILVSQQVAAQVAQQVSKALEPLHVKQASDAAEQHYSAIYKAHPDADSIVESKEFADWLAMQPSMARAAYLQVLDPDKGGSAQQVIELFDAFTNGTRQATPAIAGVKEKAQAAIAQVRAPVPTSLSDIPGGRAAGVSREEALAGMSGIELLNGMEGMSREQIDAFLNRL